MTHQTSLDALPGLSVRERAALAPVVARYAFRLNDHYASLIDWNDPADPLRRLVVPHLDELAGDGALDVVDEAAITVARGVQHRYASTVIVMVSDTCAAYCRYCTRKRLFMDDNAETTRDPTEALAYVAAHPEVDNVLLTGGDPLLLGTRRLAELLAALRAIPHVRVIRLGTKVPAFDPRRILDDEALLAALGPPAPGAARVHVSAHFDHPRELGPLATTAITALVDRGVSCANQCPIIRGVNDDPVVLGELFARLSFIGCPQYYVFQLNPTAGNDPFAAPLVESFEIFRAAMSRGSGLARRARFVLSHATGKLEVVGLDRRHIYLRFHQAVQAEDCGRLVAYHRDDAATWLDALTPVTP